MQNLGIEVKHLESRASKDRARKEYFIEYKSPSQDVTTKLYKSLEEEGASPRISPLPNGPSKSTPWFPRHISEVGRCCTALFKSGGDLKCAGHDDPVYMKQRRMIAECAKNYKL
jgi:hypothetical protein